MEDLYATGRTAGRALAIFKGAANLLNAEFKSIEATASGNETTTPSITWLSGTAQGDGSDDRDGSSLKIKKIAVRFRVAAAAAGAAGSAIRVVFFVDTANTGSAPSASEVLNSGMSGFPTINSFDRFNVLYDEVIPLNPSGVASAFRAIVLTQVEDMHVHQLGTSNSVANARGPHVFCYIQSTETTNPPSIDLTSRMSFVDN